MKDAESPMTRYITGYSCLALFKTGETEILIEYSNGQCRYLFNEEIDTDEEFKLYIGYDWEQQWYV